MFELPLEDRRGAVAALLLGLALIAWAAAVPLAPLAAARSGWLAALSVPVYAAGGLVCHQRPERSFASAGRSWPVCARCAGIYLSAAVALAVVALPARRRRLARFSKWRAAFLVALVPIAFTWLCERGVAVPVSNALRAASGAPLGVVVAAALASCVPDRRET